jgi:hypothetical protein
VSDVGEEAVTHIDHRGGSGIRGLGPRRVRGLRDAVSVDGRLRRAESATQRREAGTGQPERASEGNHVSRGRAVATHRTRGVAHRRHRDDDLVGSGDVASHDVRADEGTLGFEALGELEDPGDRQVGRKSEGHRECGRDAAHRVDVGEIGRGRLASDLHGGRPVAAEVPALDQQVGGDDERAVAGLDLGAVVAGSDERLAVRAGPLTHEIDQRELADLADRPLIRLHGSIIAQARGRRRTPSGSVSPGFPHSRGHCKES